MNLTPTLEKYKAIVETIYKIDSYDFDNLVAEYLGNTEFQFMPVEEVGSDSARRYAASADDGLDEYDLRTVQDWKDGKFSNYTTSILVLSMVVDGFIPPGVYLISTC